MPLYVSGTLSAGSPVVDLSSDSEVVVTQSGNIYGQGQGIGDTFTQTSNYLVAVYGEVYGTSAISLAGSSVYDTSITVGATGVVLGTGASGIGINGEGGNSVNIANSGNISGEIYGVSWFGATDLNFFNNGTITSVDSDAVQLGLTGRGVNYGYISSRNSDGIDLFRNDDDVSAVVFVNHGHISGGLISVNGDSLNPDHLTNFGTLSGNVSLESGNDRFINGGLVVGDVLLENGEDLYRAIGDGVVTGTVFGGFGSDTLIGGSLNDLLDGGATGDTLVGGGGEDTLLGGTGNDRLVGGTGDDTLMGDNNDDMLYGNDGNDELIGGLGVDALRGGAGDDYLNGAGDNDVLFGNDGNDTLFGALGRDVMFGGAGADTFEYTAAAQSQVGGPNRDVIKDFETGLDVIDLSAVAAGALDFVGAAGFTGGGTGSVRAIAAGSGVLVQIDTDGDAVRDMDIFVDNVSSLTAGDFVL